MELKVGEKVYKSGKHNMRLLYDLTRLRKEIDDRYRITAGDDTEAIQKLVESVDLLGDIDRCVDLVCRFFGNQFTVQEFMDGYKVKSVNDFNALVELMTLEAISGVTNILGEEKKQLTPTLMKESNSSLS